MLLLELRMWNERDRCCQGHVGLRMVDRVRVHRKAQVQAPPGSGFYFWEFILVRLQDRPNRAGISVVDQQVRLEFIRRPYVRAGFPLRSSPVCYLLLVLSTYVISPGDYEFFYFPSVSCISTHTNITLLEMWRV